MNRTISHALTQPILLAYPNTQAIYLYGSWGTEHQRPDSDLDLAVLLPYDEAKTVSSWQWATLNGELSRIAKTERTDLVNLRAASTILRKEVIFAERLIYCADETAVHEFEMLTLSFYQKLNAERQSIIDSGLRDGRFYDV